MEGWICSLLALGHLSSALGQRWSWLLALWTWSRTSPLFLRLQVLMGAAPPALLMAGLSLRKRVNQSLVIDLSLCTSKLIYPIGSVSPENPVCVSVSPENPD